MRTVSVSIKIVKSEFLAELMDKIFLKFNPGNYFSFIEKTSQSVTCWISLDKQSLSTDIKDSLGISPSSLPPSLPHFEIIIIIDDAKGEIFQAYCYHMSII